MKFLNRIGVLVLGSLLLMQCSEDFSNPVDPGADEIIPEPPFNIATQVLADTLITLSWQATQNYGFEVKRNGSSIAILQPDEESLSTAVKNYSVQDRNFQVSNDAIEYIIFSKLPNGNENADSAQVSITLGAPSNLEVNGQSINGVTLRWTDNSAFESHYVLEHKETSDQNYVIVAEIDANETEFSHEFEVRIPQTYDYRIKAVSAKTESEYIGTQASFTLNEISNMRAEQEDTTRVSLSWSNGTGYSLGQGVYRINPLTNERTQIAALPAGSQSYVDENPPFSEMERIQYVISAIGTEDELESTDDKPEVRFPFKPANLGLSLGTNSLAVIVEWENRSQIHTTTKIYRKIGDGEIQEVASEDNVDKRFDDDGPFVADVPITYFLAHFDGNSEYESPRISDSLSIAFPAPKNLTVDRILGSDITLSWTDENPLKNSYNVYRAINNGPLEVYRTIGNQDINPVTLTGALDSQQYDTLMFAMSYLANGIESSLSNTVRLRTDFNAVTEDNLLTGTEWDGYTRLSPDGSFLAGSFRQGHVWSTGSSLSFVKQFSLNTGTARSRSMRGVRWSTDNKLAMMSSLDMNDWENHGVFVFTGSNFNTQQTFIPIQQEFQWYWAFDISADGSKIGIARQDNLILEYSVANGAELNRFDTGFEVNHFEYVHDNSGHVIMFRDNEVQRVRLSDMSTIRTFASPSSFTTDKFVLSNDGNYVIVPETNATYNLYDIQTGAEIWSIRTDISGSTTQTRAGLSPDNRYLVIIYHNASLASSKIKLLNPSEYFEYADFFHTGDSGVSTPTFIDNDRFVVPLENAKKIYRIDYTYREF